MAGRGHFDPRPHDVYRCRNADGDVLYIGCSSNICARLRQHARQKEWWGEVVSVTAETYATGWDGRMAEKSAIALEQPAYNRQFNRGLGAWGRARPILPPTDAERSVPVPSSRKASA